MTDYEDEDVDLLLSKLDAAALTRREPLDVERLAKALHQVGRVLDYEGHCDNVEGADCLNPLWHRSDAEAIAAEYARLAKDAER